MSENAELSKSIEISDDKSLLDIELIHKFLTEEANWSKGISFDLVKVSIDNSFCVGAYLEGKQIGFCRVITDYATFGNLVDMFVLEAHRGKGYSLAILDAVVGHHQLQGLRRFTLATSNKQKLYGKFGFKALLKPDSFMERYDPDVYV